jgi:hypothetical protein
MQEKAKLFIEECNLGKETLLVATTDGRNYSFSHSELIELVLRASNADLSSEYQLTDEIASDIVKLHFYEDYTLSQVFKLISYTYEPFYGVNKDVARCNMLFAEATNRMLAEGKITQEYINRYNGINSKT